MQLLWAQHYSFHAKTNVRIQLVWIWTPGSYADYFLLGTWKSDKSLLLSLEVECTFYHKGPQGVGFQILQIPSSKEPAGVHQYKRSLLLDLLLLVLACSLQKRKAQSQSTCWCSRLHRPGFTKHHFLSHPPCLGWGTSRRWLVPLASQDVRDVLYFSTSKVPTLHNTSSKVSICSVEVYFGTSNPYTFAFPTNAEARAKKCFPTEGHLWQNGFISCLPTCPTVWLCQMACCFHWIRCYFFPYQSHKLCGNKR